MKRLNHDSVIVTARIRSIHKTQLEKLASAESRTKSSMIKCPIERAYQEFIRRKNIGGVRNGQKGFYILGEKK